MIVDDGAAAARIALTAPSPLPHHLYFACRFHGGLPATALRRGPYRALEHFIHFYSLPAYTPFAHRELIHTLCRFAHRARTPYCVSVVRGSLRHRRSLSSAVPCIIPSSLYTDMQRSVPYSVRTIRFACGMRLLF